MRAKNIEHYRDAWAYHIKELATLALDANVDYNEYVKTREQLMQWLTNAIVNITNKDQINGKA